MDTFTPDELRLLQKFRIPVALSRSETFTRYAMSSQSFNGLIDVVEVMYVENQDTRAPATLPTQPSVRTWVGPFPEDGLIDHAVTYLQSADSAFKPDRKGPRLSALTQLREKLQTAPATQTTMKLGPQQVDGSVIAYHDYRFLHVALPDSHITVAGPRAYIDDTFVLIIHQ